jgi:hypothetical protein
VQRLELTGDDADFRGAGNHGSAQRVRRRARIGGRCERDVTRVSVRHAPFRGTIRSPPRSEASVTKYLFLSDDWLSQVARLVDEHGAAEAPGAVDLVMNLTITDTPFGAERLLHLGSTDGRGHWGVGHLDNADLALTTDYETAKEVFVSGDPSAGMQAFMSGKIKVAGDMAKLLAVQAGSVTADSDLQIAIHDITA